MTRKEYRQAWYQANKSRIRQERRAKARQYRVDNPGKLAAKQASARATIKGRAASMFAAAKQRAAKRGELFSLSLEHVTAGIEKGFCPRTGFAFDLTKSSTVRKNPYAPSLDRLDCNKPYTDENVQIVCWQYNTMKHEISDGELFKFCAAVVKNSA